MPQRAPHALVTARPERQPIMDAINSIIAVNWKPAEPHCTAAASPFDGKFSLVLVYDHPRMGAFSVAPRDDHRAARQPSIAVQLKCCPHTSIVTCTASLRRRLSSFPGQIRARGKFCMDGEHAIRPYGLQAPGSATGCCGSSPIQPTPCSTSAPCIADGGAGRAPTTSIC
jgi:hypothetical protein